MSSSPSSPAKEKSDLIPTSSQRSQDDINRNRNRPTSIDRPEEWLGTPSRRKSYAVKTKKMMDIPPPSQDESEDEQPTRKSSAVVHARVNDPALGSSSSHHRSSTSTSVSSMGNEGEFTPQVPSSTLQGRHSGFVPPGFTRHSLGASSSHHQSSFVTEDGKPDPEKYKSMIRESINLEYARSPQFLGGSSHHTPTPSRLKIFSGKTDTTVPISPARPDQWFTPRSGTTPTSMTRKSVPSIVGQIPSWRDKPEKLPLGMPPSEISRPSATTSNSSGKAMGESSPYMTPQERVDRKKFVAAFSAFEKSPATLPLTPVLPRGVSPRSAAKRNFVIGDDAKRKSLALNDTSNMDLRADRMNEMRYVMENLRKVAIAPQEGMTEEEKRQWIGNQLDVDGKMHEIFKDMLEKGLISSNLGPNRMDMIRRVIENLEQQLTHVYGEAKDIVEEALRQNLRKLTTTSSGAVDTIQQAIGRLKKVCTDNTLLKEGVEDIILELHAVVKSMRDGQVAQFVQVFEKMEQATPNAGALAEQESTLMDEYERKQRERARLAKARFTPQSANFLVEALAKLKCTKMNKRQLASVAGFIRHLKHVQSDEDETNLNEALHKLVNGIGSNFKSEIFTVLHSMGKLRLNDRERAALAEIVRGFGKVKEFRDEIAEAIIKLKKTQITPAEAKEAAGIMFNLRKVNRKGLDFKNSRELVSLRKVMAPERADVVAEVFSDLCKVDELSEKEIDQIVRAVAESGVEALEPTDYQLIASDYVDGLPVMILNIPDGDDYADEIEKLEMTNYIKTKKTSEGRVFRFWIELDEEDLESEEDTNNYDSDFEAGSDDDDKDEESTRPKRPSSTPRSEEVTNHHNSDLEAVKDVQTLRPITPEKEKKIRFTKKPQWRHKKHNATVVSEKRWRFEENFNVDEVVWSPLSREQYDRRKTVGAAIMKTMDKFAPFDDMLLDEFEMDDQKKK